MKFCYCDETGTGEEPFAVIVGVLVDAKRMHLTKRDWNELLSVLSQAIDKNIQELHTSNFYSGSGIWKGIDGPKRAEVITLFLKWFSERKHHLVFSAIDKEKFVANRTPALKKTQASPIFHIGAWTLNSSEYTHF